MTLSWLCPTNNYGGFAFAIHKTRFSATNLLISKKFTLSVATAQSKDLVLSVGKTSGKTVNKFDGSIACLQAGVFGFLGNSDSNGRTNKNGEENNKSKSGFGILMDSDDEDEEEEKQKISQNKRLQSVHYAFPPPIDGTVAHMQCEVLSFSDAADAGTYLVIARIIKASVHTEYWNGKCFITSGYKNSKKNLNQVDNKSNIEDEETISDNLKNYPPILSFLGSQKFGHMVPE